MDIYGGMFLPEIAIKTVSKIIRDTYLKIRQVKKKIKTKNTEVM